jgi:predicted RNA-binding Zn ribbon-like protein
MVRQCLGGPLETHNCVTARPERPARRHPSGMTPHDKPTTTNLPQHLTHTDARVLTVCPNCGWPMPRANIVCAYCKSNFDHIMTKREAKG